MPPGAPNGLDTPLPPPPPISWTGKGTIVPAVPRKEEPKEEANTPNEGSSREGEPPTADAASNASEPEDEDDPVEEDDGETTWHDVALSIAGELMMRIREDIRTKLGYTTSAGLARNKFLAKVITFCCTCCMILHASPLPMQLTASYKKPMDQVGNVAFCAQFEADTMVTNRLFYVTPPSQIILNLCHSRRRANMNACFVASLSANTPFEDQVLGR